jgi:anti-anti-sigma factor
MSLQIETRDQTVIVRPTGHISKPVAGELAELLTAAIDDGARHLVFDLSGLTHVGSDGLKVVLGAVRQLRECQGQVAFAAVSAQVRALLDIGGFLALFDEYDTVDEAIAAVEE